MIDGYGAAETNGPRSGQWTEADLIRIGGPDEVRVSARRTDGSFSAPRTIWIVAAGDRLFIRSTNGRTAGWFRAAVRAGRGMIGAGGQEVDVAFTEAAESDLPAVDDAYRRKYGRYASIIDHIVGAGPRSATLEIHPA